MRKDQVAGVLFLPETLEWAVFRRQKDVVEEVGRGRATTAGTDLPPAAANQPAPEVPADVVARLIKETAELRGGGAVAVGLSADKVLLRVVDLPLVPDEELAGMAELQADKFSPFPVESTVVSHEVLHRAEATCSVLIAVVSRDVVESAGRLLRLAQVEPARVDVTALGWCRVLGDAKKIPAAGRHLVLLLDGTVPVMVVFEHGTPVLFRALDRVYDAQDAGACAEIANEIGYTLMSVEMEHGSSECSVAVWARGSVSQDILKSIQSSAGCAVTGHSLDTLRLPQEGLAARLVGAKGIDLTPAAWRTSTQTLLKRKQLITASAVIIGVWVLLMAAFFGGLYYQGWRLGYLNRKKGEWLKLSEPVSDMRSRVLLVQKYADNERSALECLREITVCLPQGVDLTSLTYRKNEELKIVGDAVAAPLVYEFKTALDRSKLFAKVTIDVIRSDPHRGKQVFGMDLKFPKATP